MDAEGRFFINACPTGMVPTKELNAHVPITPAEIISEAISLAQLGVSMVHLHARAEDGRPTWCKEVYRRLIASIREECPELVICVSTSGRNWQEFSKRSEVLELAGDDKPDMASLTLGSLNFMHSASCNSPQIIHDLCQKMQDAGIKPELEIFDFGMINQMRVLIKKNLLKPPYYANLFFGNIYSMQPTLQQISACIAQLPEQTIYALAGIGRHQFPINQLAIALGCGARVGLEDNLFMNRNRELASNGGLVNRLTAIAAACEKNLMNASGVRAQLVLEQKTLRCVA